MTFILIFSFRFNPNIKTLECLFSICVKCIFLYNNYLLSSPFVVIVFNVGIYLLFVYFNWNYNFFV